MFGDDAMKAREMLGDMLKLIAEKPFEQQIYVQKTSSPYLT